jgi:hypothetical protein
VDVDPNEVVVGDIWLYANFAQYRVLAVDDTHVTVEESNVPTKRTLRFRVLDFRRHCRLEHSPRWPDLDIADR